MLSSDVVIWKTPILDEQIFFFYLVFFYFSTFFYKTDFVSDSCFNHSLLPMKDPL